jgi:hypothetical protein
MTDPNLPALHEAVAKIAPCPKCSGAGFLVTNSSHAEHDAGCDGSCRNCPVEVPDQDIGPCDCEFAQANLTEADLWRLASALPALLDELETLKARTCKTCRYVMPDWSSAPTHGTCGVSGLFCQTHGFTCGAWQQKDEGHP